MAEQPQGLLRPLRGSPLQPVAALRCLQRPRLAAVAAKRQLRLKISSTRGLAQQLKTEPAITRRTAVAAEQLTKTALRHHDALTRRLLEQMPGETLGAMGFADTRAIQ